MIKLYNTLTREKEEFIPIEKGKVGIYTCGPTVYWFAHVGNFRAYVFADTLKRVLKFNGFDVKHVINVTDVGHLTSDGDTGEDKLEKAGKSEGKTAKEISEFYFDAFKKDFAKLNLIEPDVWPKATEHISEQIDMIKVLEEKGFTYRTSDGIYFDTSKFSDYGKLSRKKIDELEAGKRIDMRDKKNVTDFALWKFSKPEDKRQQEWDSPWGVGFPGWHIECSAMSSKYLGKHFDIHTGGEDHIPVHHENEIAQSECAFGCERWVNYWMHVAFLNLKGGKMSKSTGKIKTISQLETDGISPMAYRYFTYTAHYRKPLTWSEESIGSAVNSYDKLRNIICGLIRNENLIRGTTDDENKYKKDKKEILDKNKNIMQEYLGRFVERINDDLDMPCALAILWEILREDIDFVCKLELVKEMDEVFGLNLFEVEKVEIPSEILEIANERQKARVEKNWAKSDELRDLLNEKGWKILDSKEGFDLEKL